MSTHMGQFLMVPETEEATALVRSIATQVTGHIGSRGATGKSWGPKTQEAVARILGDLVQAIGRSGVVFWQWGNSAFIGKTPGVRPSKAARNALVELGFMELAKEHTFSSMGKGSCAAYRATDKLKSLVLDAGITPDHFKSDQNALGIIRLKERNWKDRDPNTFRSVKVRGKSVRVPNNPETKALSEQLREINRGLGSFSLDGAHFEPLVRIFSIPKYMNLGAYQWDKHGRLYSIGDTYQFQPKAARADLRIDGEPVAELDLKASGLSIVRGLVGPEEGLGTWADSDPYEIPGIPREVVKKAITVALGRHKWPKQWSAEVKAALMKKGVTEEDIKKHSALKVVPQVIQKYPFLDQWLSGPRNIFDIMFIESQVIIGLILGCLKDTLPCFPIHDGVLCPKSAKDLVAARFKATFAHTIQEAGGLPIVPALSN